MTALNRSRVFFIASQSGEHANPNEYSLGAHFCCGDRQTAERIAAANTTESQPWVVLQVTRVAKAVWQPGKVIEE